MAWKFALGAVGTALALLGCDSGCDEDTIDRAVAFIHDNLACQTADDCVTVRSFCGELPGAHCGQITINKQGAESSARKAIERELADCAPSSCTVDDCQLIPSCTAGACSR